MKIDNPYYNEFVALHADIGMTTNERGWFPNDVKYFDIRQSMVFRYAWAVPNMEAIEAIVALNKPVVEMAAGSGYWAWLLTQAGADVTAYDRTPSKWETRYLKVKRGTPKKLVEWAGRDYALMLCWPPYADTCARDALEAYTGDTVIYVGEGFGGCTGDNTFHAWLRNKWDAIDTVGIPQWYGMRDRLMIYKRKEVRHVAEQT